VCGSLRSSMARQPSARLHRASWSGSSSPAAKRPPRASRSLQRHSGRQSGAAGEDGIEEMRGGVGDAHELLDGAPSEQQLSLAPQARPGEPGLDLRGAGLAADEGRVRLSRCSRHRGVAHRRAPCPLPPSSALPLPPRTLLASPDPLSLLQSVGTPKAAGSAVVKIELEEALRGRGGEA